MAKAALMGTALQGGSGHDVEPTGPAIQLGTGHGIKCLEVLVVREAVTSETSKVDIHQQSRCDAGCSSLTIQVGTVGLL